MISSEKFILYKNYDFKNERPYEKITSNENGLINRMIFNNIFKIDIYYTNGKMRCLNQIESIDFNKKEVIIKNALFNPTVWNMQFEADIEKIIIIGSAIDANDVESEFYYTTAFKNLKLYNIDGGFNTDSSMILTLRSNI